MTGYTRNDTTNNIANGNVINAADLDGEFDAIQSAFDASTGHAHDGTVGGGAPIEALGPAQDVVITTSVLRPKTDNTVDLGTSTLEFKDLYLDGTAKVDTLTVDESATITANLTVNGNTTLGNAATDTVTVTADVASHLIPATDNTYDLGGASDEWRNLYIDGTAQVDTLQVDESATITADLTVNGNTTLGNATTDTLTLTAQLATSVLPSTDDAVDLGSSSKEWRDLYVDGTANIDTLVADTATISAGTATLSAGTIIASTGGTLTLQRNDTAITTGETLGEIDFQAPNVSGGGDAIVVAATIRAVARDTFDAAVNKTSLLFETANSGAVTTRMEVDGTGNVAVDTDTLYVDAVNDRVGINNASPTVALDVTGAATVSGDLTIADKIVHSGDTNTSIRFPAADTVTVETSGSERLRIDSVGNVGIGTSSPNLSSSPRALTVGGSSECSFEVQGSRVGTDGNVGGLRYYNGSNQLAAILARRTGADNSGSILAYTASAGVLSERMRIDESGNVGIGTSSPADKLVVIGTGSFTGALQLTADSSLPAAGAAFYRPTSNTLGFVTASTERMRIDSSGNLLVGKTSTSGAVVGLSLEPVGVVKATRSSNISGYFNRNDSDGSIISFAKDDTTVGSIGAAAGGIYFGSGSSATERMRIDSSGNVGIGTSSPSAKLEVATSGNTPEILRLYSDQDYADGGSWGSFGGYQSFWGRVDGTASQDYEEMARSGFLISGSSGNPQGNYYISTRASGGALNERMRIDSSGNVGIGTSSPTSLGTGITTLELKGNSASQTDRAGGINFMRYDGNPGMYVYHADDASYIASLSTYPLLIQTNGSERMRIDSSGNVGIGDASPDKKLVVYSSSDPDVMVLSHATATTDTQGATLLFRNESSSGSLSGAEIGYRTGSATDRGSLIFSTSAASNSPAERARIDSSGDFFVNKTSVDDAVAGVTLQGAGTIRCSRADALAVFNRLSTDGVLVELRQAGTLEGTISVSGTTVSYNGGHLSRWAQLPDNSRPDLLKGTVMSNLDQMSNWDNEDNEQLNCVQVSDVEGDANVAGVFVAWDSTDDEYNDILLAMTGDMVIRIAAGTTVQRGDLLMSAGDGTAKPQGDDIVRAKTIAKVTSTHVSHTYEDGSYAVPCVLMAC